MQHYHAQIEEFVEQVREQKDHINKHLIMMQQNKQQMLHRVMDLAKKNLPEVQEIE